MKQKDIILSTIDSLRTRRTTDTAIIGLDGYVDRIKKAVSNKSDDSINYYQTINSFAAKIQNAAGLSAQLEMETQAIKIGGNAPIMANAMAIAGITTTCIGAMGYPEVDSIFQPIPSQLISIGNPAQTDAIEFDDGKLILSDLANFQEIDWHCFEERVSKERITKRFQDAALVAWVGLSNMPHATNVITHFLNTIKKIEKEKQTTFFFDIADPSRLTAIQLEALLNSIVAYKQCGKVIVGLNANEVRHIHRKLTLGDADDLINMSVVVFNRLQPDELLVHPMSHCILLTKENVLNQPGRIVSKPKVLTGAGDNLNAGYCLGHLLGLDARSRLVLGMAHSGAYITLGKSPNIGELIDYLSLWQAEL